jgi:hypothetical protein
LRFDKKARAEKLKKLELEAGKFETLLGLGDPSQRKKTGELIRFESLLHMHIS